MAGSYAIMYTEPIFFIHFCVLVHLGCGSVLHLETGLAGMAGLPSLEMSFPCLCAWHVAAASPSTSMSHFLKTLQLFSLVDEPMQVFTNPIQINFWMGVSIPKFFPFLFCEPSFLIISCICSHPSTLSFSIKIYYSVCFGIQQSDSVFSWDIYHLKIMQNHVYISLCCIQYSIIFLKLYIVIFIS